MSKIDRHSLISIYSDGVSIRTKNRRVIVRQSSSESNGAIIEITSLTNPTDKRPHVNTTNKRGRLTTSFKLSDIGFSNLLRAMIEYQTRINNKNNTHENNGH